MNILAIESSCDETAVAVVQDGRRVLSDAIFSQVEMHALYGGVVPEVASRSHIQTIVPLADRAVREAGIGKLDIDAIAVTYAPGLIGAVLVGVNFAKAAAYALGIPLIPVHHIRGHIAANYITHPELEPPFLALVVSGGNTLIANVRGYTDIEIIGQTRDDAAGECFDKAARVMGIGYPGGAKIDALAKTGDENRYILPHAKVAGNEFDMSFSGLKTAVVNAAHNAQQKGEELDKASLSASFQKAVSDALIPRTIRAAELTGNMKIVLCGGVSANSRIRGDMTAAAAAGGFELYMPDIKLCGDNAAMIGSQAYYEYLAGVRADMELDAYANMDLSKLKY